MDPSGVFIAGIHIPTKTIEAGNGEHHSSPWNAVVQCCAYWSFQDIAMIHAAHTVLHTVTLYFTESFVKPDGCPERFRRSAHFKAQGESIFRQLTNWVWNSRAGGCVWGECFLC